MHWRAKVGILRIILIRSNSLVFNSYFRMLLGQKPCKDCEPAQVNHFVIRTSSYMGVVLKPLLRPLDYLFQTCIPTHSFSWFDAAGPLVLRAFALIRLGKLETQVSEKDSDRTRALWGEAKRRGIELRQFRFGEIKELFIAKHGGKTRCFDGLPRPRGPQAGSLYWMDNKPVMREKFKAAGIPIANGGAAFSEKEGLRIFDSLQKPVITKPYSGSRSRHTTIHIHTKEEFLKGFRNAKVLSPKVLIEEELEGFVFRGTLIGGKLEAALRREPPHVIGDGKHTVRELVAEENNRPERSQGNPRLGKTESGHTHTFHPLVTGAEAEAELARQKLTWTSIPAKGAFVPLHPKISRGVGASNSDVTDDVHPDNKALLEKIGALLKDPLVGVDFIMNDVRFPWREQPRSGVIECNSLPFIDLHHYPLNGSPRNVAGALWELIFPESSRKEF